MSAVCIDSYSIQPDDPVIGSCGNLKACIQHEVHGTGGRGDTDSGSQKDTVCHTEGERSRRISGVRYIRIDIANGLSLAGALKKYGHV
jgi:hypothetical protein